MRTFTEWLTGEKPVKIYVDGKHVANLIVPQEVIKDWQDNHNLSGVKLKKLACKKAGILFADCLIITNRDIRSSNTLTTIHLMKREYNE